MAVSTAQLPGSHKVDKPSNVSAKNYVQPFRLNDTESVYQVPGSQKVDTPHLKPATKKPHEVAP